MTSSIFSRSHSDLFLQVSVQVFCPLKDVVESSNFILCARVKELHPIWLTHSPPLEHARWQSGVEDAGRAESDSDRRAPRGRRRRMAMHLGCLPGRMPLFFPRLSWAYFICSPISSMIRVCLLRVTYVRTSLFHWIFSPQGAGLPCSSWF